MRRPWRLLNLGSKHIFLNIRIIAANTLNTCTAPFPSASAELRRFINRLIITNKCGKQFPGESESKKRRVLTIRQVCVNTRKSSAGSGSIKISKTASDKVTTGALSKYGESSPWKRFEICGQGQPAGPVR